MWRHPLHFEKVGTYKSKNKHTNEKNGLKKKLDMQNNIKN